MRLGFEGSIRPAGAVGPSLLARTMWATRVPGEACGFGRQAFPEVLSGFNIGKRRNMPEASYAALGDRTRMATGRQNLPDRAESKEKRVSQKRTETSGTHVAGRSTDIV